jgi:hypothetical protein
MEEEQQNLESFQDFERTRVVNTPKSLEACRKEGVIPTELLYKPLESFAKPGQAKEVTQVKYEFFEAKRLESLQAVRKAKQAAIESYSLSASKSNPALLSRSDQFERSLQQAKERQASLLSRAALTEAMEAKKLSKLRNDEDAKLAAERERRKADLIKTRKEAEDKRKADMEKMRKAKEEEEMREKLRIEQQERDGDFMKRLQEREEKLVQLREKQKEHRERLKEQILQRLTERQREQEILRAQRDHETAHKEEVREFKLEDQKRAFKLKLEEKAKLRTMKRAQAKKQAENHFRQVKNIQKATEILQSDSKMQLKSAEFRQKLAEKMEWLRKISAEKERKMRQVHESAMALSGANRTKMLESMAKSQQRAEQQRRRIIEQFELKKQMSEMRKLKKDYLIERQKRRKDYEAEQSNRRLAEMTARIQAFETVKERMLLERRNLNLQNEHLKMSIKEAMRRMRISKKWDEGEIEKLLDEYKQQSLGSSKE